MKLCFLGIHKWTKYSKEKTVTKRYVVFATGKEYEYQAKYQEKECINCGKIIRHFTNGPFLY